jgi:hypothetical protein
MNRMKLLPRTTLAVAAALLFAPAAAQAQADVTLSCGPSATLPGGPPERAGTITVIDANGNVRVVRTVPGPCSAPGHPTNR